MPSAMPLSPNTKAGTKHIGDWGEQVAAQYLQKHHFEIIAKNYRTRYGEIDLIVRRGDAVIFVEVKTRHENTAAQGAYAVTARKLKKIWRAGQTFLQKSNSHLAPQIDVIEVWPTPSSTARIRHYRAVY